MAAMVQPILAYFCLQNLCIDPTAPAAKLQSNGLDTEIDASDATITPDSNDQ